MTSKETEDMKSGTAEQNLAVQKSKHVDLGLLDNANSLSQKVARLGIDPKPGYRIEPALGGHLSIRAVTRRRTGSS